MTDSAQEETIHRVDIARPPVYTPYPNPYLGEFVNEHLKHKPYDPLNDLYYRDAFVRDIKAGKNDPIYNAHSYHTKVPPKGIEPFIEHYTEAGELILDPFCGSGMAGVAALKLGRKAILIDLSPAATFITYNYCAPVDPEAFRTEADYILEMAREEMEWLYETRCRGCGGKAIIEYTVWSDTFRHPVCQGEFLLWEAAVDQEGGEVLKNFPCPHCGTQVRKTDLVRTGTVPVRVNYTCPKCKRKEDDISDFDLQHLQEIEERGVPQELWYPDYRMPEGDESRRNDKIGISHVHHFYTTRNLWALARLWKEIHNVSDMRIAAALLVTGTSCNPFLVSKLTRYNFGKRGPGPISGTLYIPSFTVERNIPSVFAGKVDDFARVWGAYKPPTDKAMISVQSACALTQVDDDSVDYVFTDPPYGANLMYSELDFVWNAWLGHFTDTKEEAIINDSQGKGLSEYAELMTRAFAETYRVLKPGRWLTVVFHNSSTQVWQAIQEGLSDVGFQIGSIHIFDKVQKSFKGITAEGAVGYDVIINCQKPRVRTSAVLGNGGKELVLTFLMERMRQVDPVPNDERTSRKLYSRTVSYLMEHRIRISEELKSYEAFCDLLDSHFKSVDGFWYLPGQVPRGERQLPMAGVQGVVRTETDAIDWLWQFLDEPKEWDEIYTQFLIALGGNRLEKELREILEENFTFEEDEGKWRRPTEAEREELERDLDAKQLRKFQSWARRMLEKLPARSPTDDVLVYGFKRYLEEKRHRDIVFLAEHLSKEKRESLREVSMIYRIGKQRLTDEEALRR